MADDVTITPGSGATVATDDVGGRHFQRVKVAVGPDGTAADLATADLDSGVGVELAPKVAISVPASGGGLVVGGDANGLDVDLTRPPTCGTASVSSVAASTSSTVLAAANAGRKGLMLFNDSSATLYVLFGSGTASSASHSVQLGPGGYYEAPWNYTGDVKGAWSSASGAARVTEFG